MVLIGLMGYKHAGKDTFADYLVQKYGFQKYAFADPVKQICKIMFRLEQEQLDDPTAKETLDRRWGMTPRQMMQRVGTDMVRRVWDDDFWVRNMDMRVQQDHPGRVVVSDVRFQNEAEWVRQNKGILVRVVDGRQNHDDTHASETEQLSIQEDVCIVNAKKGVAQFHHEIEKTLSFLCLSFV